MMQNFCILSLIIFVSVLLKSTCSTLFEESQANFDYRFRPLSGTEYSEKVSNEEEADEDKRLVSHEDSSYSDDTLYSNREIHTDVELIRYLLNRYLEENVSHHATKLRGAPIKHVKRALTVLSRWKPFQIPNAIAGNGHHAVRTSLISRSDPLSKLQIMGRPFRWG